MKQMFNRGFTKGYLLHDNNFMAKEYPGNRGIDLGTVVDYDKKRKVVLPSILKEVIPASIRIPILSSVHRSLGDNK